MKKITLLIFAFFMLLFVSVSASNRPLVCDDADLLSDSQEAELTSKINTIREKYDFEIALHTVNSIGSKSIVNYADDFFIENDYGVGGERDGMLFVLNMNNGEEGNRDYYTATHGFGIKAFTDYAIHDSESKINSIVLDYLIDGDWYGAFDEYLNLCDIFLEQAKTGEPFDENNPYKTNGDYILYEIIAFVIAVVVAVIVMIILISMMNTAVKNTGADSYVVPGSFAITGQFDRFSYRTVSRILKEQPKTSGGSSTHIGSGGSSFGGGGGKF